MLAGDNTPRRLKPGQFQLTGTAVSGDRNIAFLKETGGKSRVVRQGDEILYLSKGATHTLRGAFETLAELPGRAVH